VAQFCYIDDIESWSTNELTINWNAPLAWVSAFLAGQGDAAAPGAATCRVAYAKKGEWSGGFISQVTVTNTGSTPVNGWTLAWSFWGGQHIDHIWSATAQQSGATVQAASQPWNAMIKPGRSVTFGFTGAAGLGVNSDPALFTLNGRSCASG